MRTEKDLEKQFKKLLRLHGKTIIIVPSKRRIADPEEKNYNNTELAGIPIKVLEKQFSSHGLIWKNYGLKEIGAKKLIIQKKHIQLFENAYKVRIKDYKGELVDYLVFRDAQSSKVQIWEHTHYAEVILERL